MSSTRSLPSLDETSEVDFRAIYEDNDDEIPASKSSDDEGTTLSREFGPEHTIPIQDGINRSSSHSRRSSKSVIKSLVKKISLQPSLASSEGMDGSNKSGKRRIKPFSGKKASVVRESEEADPETGEVENHEVIVEPIDTCQGPQEPNVRRAKEFLCRLGLIDHDDILDIPEEQVCVENYKQYRLTTKRKTRQRFGSCIHFEEPQLDSHYADNSSSELISRYLNWSFRTSFWLLILKMLFNFWLLVIIFSGLILLASYKKPECMQVGSLESDQVEHHLFADAFSLSWTTFSTVGYGIVFPQVSSINDNPHCWGVNFLMALEAFIGVLFVATCSALIYGKVSRVQAYANVLFSDTMVIKYGQGARDYNEDEDTCANPFPVLEFRIANLMSGRSGGEIVSSRCLAIASIKESRASKSLKYAAGLLKKAPSVMHLVRTHATDADHQSTRWKPHGPPKAKSPLIAGKKLKASVRAIQSIFSMGHASFSNLDSISGDHLDDFSNHGVDDDIVQEGMELAKNGVRSHMLMDEGSHLVPRRILSPLVLTSNRHPFFRSAWIVRHVIDQRSPLLTGHAKKMIAENKGKWPSELNCPIQLRKVLHFHQLIVSFTGTSQATRSRVYKQKLYEFEDLAVGYTFVETMFEHKSGRIHMDPNLINGVREQRGGGGEPYAKMRHGGKNVYADDGDPLSFHPTQIAEEIHHGGATLGAQQPLEDIPEPPPPPPAEGPEDTTPIATATKKEHDGVAISAISTEQGGKKDK